MGGYASGKYSLALCDRCGQRYPYLVLRKEWTGFKVCPECYEPKHPQLEPIRTKGDVVAIYEPRPDIIEPVTVYLGAPGNSFFAAVGMMPESPAQAIMLDVELGNVTVSLS